MCFALCACGAEPAPQAAPGAVERTTEALDRQDAAEKAATTRRNDREADARADAAERRLEAVSEKEKAK